MRILFWNVQNANPVDTCGDTKGGVMQQAVLQANADVLIFCEVLNEAICCAEIAQVKKTLIACTEAEKQCMPSSLLDKMSDPQRKKVQKGFSRIGLRDTRTRAGYVTESTHNLKRSASAMSDIGSALEALDEPATKRRCVKLEDNQDIKIGLNRAPIPQISIIYKYWYALDSDQKDRNYLIYSKENLKIEQIDVDVEGAKRKIVELKLLCGKIIYAVHSPAYGKGGGLTAIQLTNLIHSNGGDAIAIGDMNIDLEELTTEVEEEAYDKLKNPLSYCKLFTSTGIVPIGPGPQISNKKVYTRRWHTNRPPIEKTLPATQKAGGTLDYVLAKSGKGISVEICIGDNPYSDHAAILMYHPDWPTWT